MSNSPLNSPQMLDAVSEIERVTARFTLPFADLEDIRERSEMLQKLVAMVKKLVMDLTEEEFFSEPTLPRTLQKMTLAITLLSASFDSKVARFEKILEEKGILEPKETN